MLSWVLLSFWVVEFFYGHHVLSKVYRSMIVCSFQFVRVISDVATKTNPFTSSRASIEPSSYISMYFIHPPTKLFPRSSGKEKPVLSAVAYSAKHCQWIRRLFILKKMSLCYTGLWLGMLLEKPKPSNSNFSYNHL